MLKNYFSIGIKNLLKNKFFTLINLTGLSIGLATCLLIAFYIQEESSYDEHWGAPERIYRVTGIIDRTGSNPRRAGVNSFLLMPALKQAFPDEIEAGSRMRRFARDFIVDSRRFEETLVSIEPDFIEIFDLEILDGSLQDVLADKSSIALSKDTAQRFFGGEPAMDQIITLGGGGGGEGEDLRVGAVYRLPHGNTVLDLPIIRLLDPSTVFGTWLGPLVSRDFVRIAPGVDVNEFNTRLRAFSDRYVDITPLEVGPEVMPSDRVNFELQNIADIYLNSPFEGSGDRGNRALVMASSAIALLVLLIGCINFTILSTAKATKRSREVAMRKTIGANRIELGLQFLGESLLIVLIAMLFALALVELILPFFQSLIGLDLSTSYDEPGIWLALVLLLLAVALAGGLYPAFILSGFRPGFTLTANQSTESQDSIRLRNVLVVFQFSISIALTIATAVIFAQLSYNMSRDPGFDAGNLLVVEGLGEVGPEQKNLLKRRIGALSSVSDVSLSGHRPMQRAGSAIVPMPFSKLESPEEVHQITTLSVDYDFFRAHGIPLLTGRDYEEGRDRPTPLFRSNFQAESSQGGLVVNASAARDLGFANPEEAIGARLRSPGFNDASHEFSIIGVVADTQFSSLRALPSTEVYVLYPEEPQYMMNMLTLRFTGDFQNLLGEIGQIWEEVVGEQNLSTVLVEQSLAGEFERERAEARLLVGFSLFAILIACLGLLGSATFNVERRTKEIGIRKVMGAEVREIVTLLLWQFSKPVMFANVIAWPIAVWAMLNWLQRFAYQIDAWLLLPLCVMAGLIALCIAWVTVGGTAAKAAGAKPVLALRYE